MTFGVSGSEMGLGMTGFSRPQRLSARPTVGQALWLPALAVLSLGAATAAADTVPPGAAGEPFAGSRSYLRTHTGAQQVWFVCSALDGFDQTVVGLPMKGGKLWVAQPLSGEPSDVYRLGRPDPGAGQVYWPLSDSSGKPVGALHAFNPGVLGEGRYATTPTFVSIRANAAQFNCRWLEHTRLLGFSSKRVIEIFSGQNGLEYQSFDERDAGRSRKVDVGSAQQSTTPSLDLKHGRTVGGAMRFQNGAYTFQVTASGKDARIVVSQNGKTILNEPLIAWTIGVP